MVVACFVGWWLCDDGVVSFIVRDFVAKLLNNLFNNHICTMKTEFIDRSVGISKFLMCVGEGELEVRPCFVDFGTTNPFPDVSSEDSVFR